MGHFCSGNSAGLCASAAFHDGLRRICPNDMGSCQLEKLAKLRRLKAGDAFASENGVLPLVGVVLTGVLRMTQTLADGRQQIVGLLFQSNLVGRPFADISHYGIEAATEVTLCVYERARFEEILLFSPWLERALLTKALDELDAARRWTTLVSSPSIKERIAAFLLMCAPGNKSISLGSASVSPTRIAVPISRRDMASLLGTTPETISRFVRELMRQGTIRIRSSREFDLINHEAMRRLAGQAASIEFDSGKPAARIRSIVPSKPKFGSLVQIKGTPAFPSSTHKTSAMAFGPEGDGTARLL